MKLLSLFEQKSKAFWLLTGLLLVAVIGAIDSLTGYELAFSPFYLIPVVIVAWFVGFRAGMLYALVSSLVWFSAENFAGQHYSYPIIYFWNTMLRLANFIVVVVLVTRLKRELNLQKHLAYTDAITGLANSRSFFESLETEIAQAARYGRMITVMYIDLDNFKVVNDLFGHSAGDQALCQVANTLHGSLRKTDYIARIGGDEFAVVLPETGLEAAVHVSKKIQEQLTSEMEKQDWSITFSMGVVYAAKGSSITSPESILHQADNLMYIAKKNGKNQIEYAAYQPD
jgi:diguanylate cyclase (GGDEF)-like protein